MRCLWDAVSVLRNITESAGGAVEGIEGEGDKTVGDSGLCVNDGVDYVTDAHVGLGEFEDMYLRHKKH